MTKIHLLVNAHGLPVRAEITLGQTLDYLGGDLVMADNLPRPSALFTDHEYDADKIRDGIEARNVLPMIPMRKSRKKRIAVDRSPYRLRNLVEHRFNKERLAGRNLLRRDGGKVPWLHRYRIKPPLDPPCVNMTYHHRP